MEASELRIGNLLQDKLGEVVTVESVSEYGLNYYSWSDTHYGTQSGGFDYNYKLEDVAAIPLTEEWLVKFGGEPLYDVKRSKELNEKYSAQVTSGQPLQFEYQEKAYAYRLNGELIRLNYTGFNGPLGPVMEVGDRKIVFTYVHQLQNLFFALRGEELAVK